MDKNALTQKPKRGLRSACPVAAALDVLHDLLWGKCRYGEFVASPEGIPTNIMADRLLRLEEC